MAKKFYSLENILATKAQYRMLLGEKSNGKSYAVKSHLIDEAFRLEKKFIYMRRYREDCKVVDVNAYFSDAPVRDITKHMYERVIVDRETLYLANWNEDDGKWDKGPDIGRVVYLSGYEHFASQAFPDTYNIVYEEFITQRIYLNNEPALLQKMVSTILRDREGAVYLVGNTINRVCPYFTEWQLTHTIRQKPGTIEIYKFHRSDEEGNDIITEVAVERCESSNSGTHMFFGKTAEFIVKGGWEVYDKPKLPEENTTTLYELVLESQSFAFVLKLMVTEQGGMFIYVYPYTYKRTIKRIITDRFDTSPFVTKTFNPKIRAEVMMQELIKQNKICYSDNLTGSDFEQVLKNRR